ncbi:transcriptional regulator GcvA [Rhizobium lusitanum]|uniref:transcriptional regulator GcvA n=1 Tax=Rhizobium lusitanum TaxID=293958 RepID=UPI0015747725|nr:transcriptional regulator GcvA [Rhizobium lusitanum]NTJ11779.1 transcriptional regulator GcvA [Rhizobium lusitanum]
MRRTLPSLSALVAFESAARYSSFTRAGEELGLTQSAVSRQIAYLEHFLGITLFERVRRRVILTEAGQTYASQIRMMLNRAEAATIDLLTVNGAESTLRICSLATFATHWLMPRLGSFLEKHPNISVQISSYHHHTFEDITEDIDVAIHYGGASWPDGLVDKLFEEELIPVCTPTYAEKHNISSPADLVRATLLQQTTRPDAWLTLLRDCDIDNFNALKGPRFEMYSMIIEGAIAGIGVGAVPRFLISDHLREGRLVTPFEKSVRSTSCYYLAYPEAKRQLAQVRDFRRWIRGEASRAL